MSKLALSLTQHELDLVREFLQNSLPKLDAVIQSSDSTAHEVKRAQFHKFCVEQFLVAEHEGGKPVVMAEEVMKVVLHYINADLATRAKAMQQLAHDCDMPQDNYLQVVTHAAELLPLMRKLTLDALQGNNTGR